jgi:hypothetical protein
MGGEEVVDPMTWFSTGVALLTGAAIAGLWTMLLATRQVPELAAGQRAIKFHIAAEYLTAAACLLGGVGLWLAAGWGSPLALAGLGAALYSSVNSPGYYADLGKPAMVAAFGVLATLLALAIGALILA